MDEREQERRGEDARQIIDNPLYVESWQVPREKLISRIEREDLSDVDMVRICYQIQAMFKARVHLKQIMVTGHFAATEIERKRSLLDRFKRRA